MGNEDECEEILARCCVSSNILQALNAQRKSMQFCDITLICDEKRIVAHKSILAATSPYFAVMFSGRYKDSSQKEIELYSLDSVSLEKIVDFMYGIPMEALQKHTVMTILQTALFLQVECVIQPCTEFILQELSVVNCLEYWRFAKLHALTFVERAASRLVEKHFIEVSYQTLFISLTFEELLEFLSRDKINKTKSADALMHAIARWYTHDYEERSVHLKALLDFIEPGCITQDAASLWDNVRFNKAAEDWLQKFANVNQNREWYIFMVDKMGRNAELQRIDMSMKILKPLQPCPKPSFAHTVVGYKGMLWLQGGRTSNKLLAYNYIYNIHADAWFNTDSPLLVPRSHHRAVVLHDKIYLLGGHQGRESTASVESLDCETHLALFEPDMLTKRGSMGASVHGGCIYVMAGETNNRSIKTLERLDPRTGNWAKLPSLAVVESYATSATIGDSIYCCQGLGSCMERFDIKSNEWELISLGEQREFYELFTANNELYSVSGNQISHFSVTDKVWTDVYNFDITRDWDTAVGIEMSNYIP